MTKVREATLNVVETELEAVHEERKYLLDRLTVVSAEEKPTILKLLEINNDNLQDFGIGISFLLKTSRLAVIKQAFTEPNTIRSLT